MKKIVAVVLNAVLCLGLLSGCGQNYEASESTVFICKDGKVVSTDVESFDENIYDEEGLKNYIEKAIGAYTEVYGEESVVLKELAVKEGVATLVIEYASATDYSAFNNIELYTGSVSSALASGYSFDTEFAAVKDGVATLCHVSDFIGGEYKAVIIRNNVNIHIDGTVAYLSTANTGWVDKSTIEIREGIHLLGKTPVLETEGETESKKETETEEAQETEENFPVIDEDLLDVTEAESEIVFEFEEEPLPETQESENGARFSTVYTYIIYK